MSPRKTAAAATSSSSRRLRPSQKAPALLAGIDIGSTAIRMKIAECAPVPAGSGAALGSAGSVDTGASSAPPLPPLRLIEDLSHPISTGADSFRRGRIQAETFFSIQTILANYSRVLDGYGVLRRRAVASSAVREAANREILVDRIRHNSGLDLEILDAIEETRLAYRALLPWLRERPGAYSMALNIGGGSTEIMILRGDDLQTGGVRRIGASRLFHAAGKGSGHVGFDRLQATAANIVGSTREAYQDYSISRLLLINRLLHQALRSDPAAVHHERDFVIPAEAVRSRIRDTVFKSPMEIGRLTNMGLADVEMLTPALLILDQFVDASSVAEVTFTDTDVLAGLLSEMAMELAGVSPLASFRRQMVRAARDIGEQYNYDRAHARLVTDFALTLFDALRLHLDLGERDRVLLELASVLHDIGMHVAEKHHHRHSAYLIRWSEIVGLSERDRQLVSQIAYFHRSGMPSGDHPDYMALALADRLRVGKLAGILRLADVFDRGHRQIVKSLHCTLAENKLLLRIDAAGDMDVILDALPKKANLLEAVAGLAVVVSRNLPGAQPG